MNVRRRTAACTTSLFLVAALFATARPAVAAPAATGPRISAPPDVIVSEGAGHVDLPVKLSSSSASTVTVHVKTGNSTAFGGSSCNASFVGVDQTLTFSPGDTSKTVSVALNDCAANLGFRSFTLDLDTPVNATIARASARVGIVDHGTVVATPSVFVRNVDVDENAGTVSVPVILGGADAGVASASTVTVKYTTVDDTATAGSDYTAKSGTLTFAPGENVKNVNIPIANDTVAEPAERLDVTLSQPTNATLGDATGVVTIEANDQPATARPTIAAPVDEIVGEGDAYVDLPVNLSAPGTKVTTVHVATVNSTAFSGTSCNGSFVGVDQILTYAPGETSKIVRVDINDCAANLGFRSFTLDLDTPVNATLTRASARVGIVDHGTVSTAPGLFVRGAVVDENAGTVDVPVILGGADAGVVSNSTVTVNYTTADDSATAPGDYTTETGTLTFTPGENVKHVTIPIRDDAKKEPAKGFDLTLSHPTNATLGDATGVVTIAANDQPKVAKPGINTPADAIVSEGDSYVDLPVTLSAPATKPVTVHVATANSTAFGGTSCNASFVAVDQTLTFTPGDTAKIVRVDINDCAANLGFRSFTLDLDTPVNATLTRASVRVGIVDHTTVVTTPQVFVRDTTVDEKAGTADVPVILGGTDAGVASNSTITVKYTTADDTATAGSDYTTETGTLSFAPGETVKHVIIPITDDTTPEAAERFDLTLSHPTNATLGDATGVVTIGPNDQAATAQPAVSAPANLTVSEADGYIDLAFTLSGPGTAPVTVRVASVNGTAFSGTSCNASFVAVAPTLVYSPGETTKTVRVDLLDCSAVQGTRSFTVKLAAPTSATIGQAKVKVTIHDA